MICLLLGWPCWILTNYKSSPKFPAGQLSQISSVISREPKTIKKPCTFHDFRVHYIWVSGGNWTIGSTTAQYTLILVTSRTPRSLQRRLVSLPNDPLALPIRAGISSTINAFCDIVLPNNVKLSVTFSGLLSIVVVGAV